MPPCEPLPSSVLLEHCPTITPLCTRGPLVLCTPPRPLRIQDIAASAGGTPPVFSSRLPTRRTLPCAYHSRRSVHRSCSAREQRVALRLRSRRSTRCLSHPPPVTCAAGAAKVWHYALVANFTRVRTCVRRHVGDRRCMSLGRSYASAFIHIAAHFRRFNA